MTINSIESPEKRRHRMWSTVFLLGVFLASPMPSENQIFATNILIISFLVLVLVTSSLIYFQNEFSEVLFVVCVLVASVMFFKGVSLVSLVFLLSFWLWRGVSKARLKLQKKWSVALALFFMTIQYIGVRQVNAQSSAQKGEENSSDVEIPKYLSGYEIKDITSCGAVNKIPWKFRPDGKKTRLLLKDRMRHQTESQFLDWEVFQVMDKDGFTSWIFRRTLANGRSESIVVKDVVYNRILETPKGSKTVEVQDLRSLVNRTALSFFHKDGSSLVYSPSSVGRSALIIQQGSTGNNRLLAPVFVRGNFCDRPDDEENSDTQNKKAVEASGAPSPSGAAPSAGAGGAPK
jgi:hypothetical protein